MNFNKNDLIDAVLIRYYATFRCTLDTADFVPEKYNDKILAYIFKNMKKMFRCIDKEDRIYQRLTCALEKHKDKHAAADTNPPVKADDEDARSTTGVNDQSEQAASSNDQADIIAPSDPTER